MILHLGEIVPGIVAFMDPERLLQFDAGCLFPYSDCVRDIHPFVCVDANKNESIWVALSSGDRYGRPLRICASWKRGTLCWTRRDSFVYGINHVWRGPHRAFQEGSHREMSHPQLRNGIIPEYIPLIRSVVNPALF